MKTNFSIKILLFFIVGLVSCPQIFAQTAEDLFISEYIEGGSNNKAIEIFNGTGADVDLLNYQIWKIGNEGEWSEFQLELTGTLVNNDVYVIANSASDQAILDQADNTEWGQANFNGDDPIGLAKLIEGTWTLIDVIGEPYPENNVTAWEVAGIENATANHTLVRKATVETGNTNWIISAGSDVTNSQWEVYEQDDFNYIGSHTFTGGWITVPIVTNIIMLPENPTSTDEITITVNVISENDINVANLNWGLTEDLGNSIPMTGLNNIYTASIPAQAGETTVYYQIMVVDSENEGLSAILNYTVQSDDVTPPEIVNVIAIDETTIVINFNEAILATSVETLSDMNIDNGITIESVSLSPNSNAVLTLTVSAMTTDIIYSLTLNNISDWNNNIATTLTSNFSYVAQANTGDVVINEIGEPYEMPNTWYASYVELYNTTSEAIDLSNWTLWSNNMSSKGTSSFVFPEGTTIAGNGYIIATRDRDGFIVSYPNVDASIIPIAENITGTGVYIANNYAFVLNNTNETTIDETSALVEWNSQVYEKTSPEADGALAENWYLTYQHNPQGTPAEANSTEPEATEYAIYQIQSEDHSGENIITTGIVTAVFESENLFTIQDETGEYSGIWVSGTNVIVGDMIGVTGMVSESFDLTLITASNIVLIDVTSATLPEATVITTAQVNEEAYEGVLVKVENAICTNADLGYGEWEVDNNNSSCRVNDLAFAYTPILNASYNIIGVINYDYNNFKIEPRNADDIIENISEDITLTITSPAANQEFTETSVEVSFIANNFVIDEITATNVDGHLHYTLDNNEPVMYYSNDPILLENLTEGEHTITLNLVDNNNASLDPAVTSSVTFSIVGIPTLSIYAIQGQVATSPYVDDVVTTTGIVTGTSDYGFFLQDETGAWSGIFVILGTDFTLPSIGDQVQITGLVYEDNSNTKIKNLTALEVLSSNNDLPTPTLITTNQVNDEDYESVLVKVENAICMDANIADNYGKWQINDDSGMALVDDVLFAYEPTLGNSYTVIGCVDYAYGDYTINPRNADDIIDNGASEASITVTSPNGGEVWYQGSTYTITWTSINYEEIVNIYITYNYDTYFESIVIIENIENTGSYEFSIDNFIELADNNVKIGISASSDATLFDESDDFFTIADGSGMPEVGDVIINEVGEPYSMTDTYENSYVELYNTTDEAIDIGGWSVLSTEVFGGTKGDASFTFPAGTIIETNGYLIATRNRDIFLANYTEVGASIVPVAESTTGSAIYVKDSYYFSIVDASSNVIDETTYEAGWNSTVLEKTTPEADGTLTESWYQTYSLTPFEGTPGAVNSTQPDATNYTIYQIQTEDHFGEMAITNGTVTAVFENANLLAIQNETGAFCGLWINKENIATDIAYNLGDNITVKGLVNTDFDHITFIQANEITINSNGNTIPEAAEITVTEALSDDYEGVLIKVTGTCNNINPDQPENYNEWQITDGTSDLRIDDLGIIFAPTFENQYTVTGILNYSYSNYKLEPRNADDIEDLGFPPDALSATALNLLSNTSFEIVFSNELNVENAQGLQHYALENITNYPEEVIDWDITSITVDTENPNTAIFVVPEMPEGQYGISFFGVIDIDGNGMSAFQVMSFTIQGTNVGNVTAEAFEIYPNPAQEVLYFKNFNQIEKIKIYNTTGQMISIDKHKSQIDLSNFESGIYFINLHTKSGKIISKKLIKK